MSKEETMVERCARAAMENIRQQLDGQPIPGLSHDPTSWSATGNSINMELVALAVIDALMEPTPEMVWATDDIVCGAGGDYGDVNIYVDERLATKVYRAMLSKAKEGTGE